MSAHQNSEGYQYRPGCAVNTIFLSLPHPCMCYHAGSLKQENKGLDYKQLFRHREAPSWIRPLLDQFPDFISRTRRHSLVSGACSLPDILHERGAAGGVPGHVGWVPGRGSPAMLHQVDAVTARRRYVRSAGS